MVHLQMLQLTPSQIVPQPGGVTHIFIYNDQTVTPSPFIADDW